MHIALSMLSLEFPGGLELRLIDSASFKSLIHWRLERGGPIYDERGKKIGEKDETQRFHLHEDTDRDYAQQILAEELCRDRRGKNLLETESARQTTCLTVNASPPPAPTASGCRPLKMLSAWMKQHDETKGETGKAQIPVRNIARSNWMTR